MKAQNKALAWRYAYALVGKADVVIAPEHQQCWRGVSQGYIGGVLNTGDFLPVVAQLARRKGAHFLQPSESYTSCTCSNCKTFKPDLGSNRVFTCGKCGMSTLRDEGNATSNILAFTLCFGAMGAAGLASLLPMGTPAFEKIRDRMMTPVLYPHEVARLKSSKM